MTGKRIIVEQRVPCVFAGTDKLGRPRTHKVTVVIDKIGPRHGEPVRTVVRTIDCSCAGTSNALVAHAVDRLAPGAGVRSCVEQARILLSFARGENSVTEVGADATERLVLQSLGIHDLGRLVCMGSAHRSDQWGTDLLPRTLEDRKLMARTRARAPSNLRPAVESFRYSSVEGYEGWWVRQPPDAQKHFEGHVKKPWPEWSSLAWLLTAETSRLGRQYPIVFPHSAADRFRMSPRSCVEAMLLGPSYCRLCKAKVTTSHHHLRGEAHERRLGKLIEVLAGAETYRRNLANAPTNPVNPFSGAPC
jgi:hypothetical protein